MNYLEEEVQILWEKESYKNKNNFYYKFGYTILGPAIYGYVSWINRKLCELDLNKIFFFAREGQFIKRAFDAIFSEKYEEHYLYVSRRSLTVPAIATTKSIEEFLEYRPIYDRVTVENQMDKLGVEPLAFKKYSWYSEKILKTTFGQLSDRTKKIIQKDMYLETIKVASTELERLCAYLEQECVYGKFAVIDLGWNGSMQRALTEVLKYKGVEAEVTGFFLAQRDEYYKNEDYILNFGYLFNYNHVKKKENLLLHSGTNLLEFLFGADHGSTRSYCWKENCIVPELEEYEYGNVYSNLKECQDAAIRFVIDFHNKNGFPEKGTEKTFFDPMYNFLKRPSIDGIKHFGDVEYSDMSERGLYLAKAVSIVPVKKFVKEFQDSGWKVAFLKRNLGLPFSFEIYAWLRKIFN